VPSAVIAAAFADDFDAEAAITLDFTSLTIGSSMPLETPVATLTLTVLAPVSSTLAINPEVRVQLLSQAIGSTYAPVIAS
jgi:type IV secretory pathway VirB2 component (pilin)